MNVAQIVIFELIAHFFVLEISLHINFAVFVVFFLFAFLADDGN